MSASDWRPDLAKGVFETLLVVDGEPVELEAHLARLEQSLASVYEEELPPQAEDELRRAAKGLALGRIRFTLVPAEDGLRHDLLAGWVVPETVFPVRGVKLRTQVVSGGHGPYKWVDRREMEHPDGGPGQLICDGEELLEAGWANIFAVREETLWTPPADGRILPGMARAAILTIAGEEQIPAHEQPLRAQDLHTADEVFLTNSIRGIEPVTSLDGTALTGCGPISHRLAAALQRRWNLPQAPQAAASARTTGQLSH